MSLKPTSPTLLAQYEAHLQAGDLLTDPAQIEALSLFQDLADQLDSYTITTPNFWDKLLAFGQAAQPPKSLYLWGDVGRGKSMLMDLFFAQVNVARKRRVHFHQFMLEIHQRLHQLNARQTENVLPSLARDIAQETALLCFDEFHVNNIADAMILGRLFEVLFNAGVVIVTTSNWRPDELYKNGLQRKRFLPFITLIQQKMTVHRLAGAVDHRYEQSHDLQHYFHPLGEVTTRKLQEIFLHLTDEAELEPITLPVQGRMLKITHTAKGVGFFNFDELCRAALGPADYLAIAHCLHTVILDDVPQFTADARNETMRFTNLIDALYEAKAQLYMAAAAPPEKLAPAGDLAFAFQRTVSRLTEMQGAEYRAKPHLS